MRRPQLNAVTLHPALDPLHIDSGSRVSIADGFKAAADASDWRCANTINNGQIGEHHDSRCSLTTSVVYRKRRRHSATFADDTATSNDAKSNDYS